MVAHWLQSLRVLELHELNPAQSGDWSLRRKSLVALALVGFVLLAGYLLQIQSALTRLEQERATETVLKAGFESMAAHVSGLDAHLQQMRHRLPVHPLLRRMRTPPHERPRQRSPRRR